METEGAAKPVSSHLVAFHTSWWFSGFTSNWTVAVASFIFLGAPGGSVFFSRTDPAGASESEDREGGRLEERERKLKSGKQNGGEKFLESH